MITDDELYRILSGLRRSYVVDWRDEEYTYNPDTGENSQYNFDVKFEEGGPDSGTSISYPRIAVSWNASSMPRRERQALDYLDDIEFDEDDGIANQTLRKPVYDDIALICGVDDDTDRNGVPAKARGKAFADHVEDYFDFGLDYNSVGPDGERPMTVELVGGSSDVSMEVNNDWTEQWQVTVRVNYSKWRKVGQRTANSFAGSVSAGDGATSFYEGPPDG